MNFAYRSRLEKLASAMRTSGPAALLVTHLPNIRYLCGFTGSAAVLAVRVGPRGTAKAAMFTDGRYTEQARSEVEGARVVIAKGTALNAAVRWLESAAEIGVEAEHLTLAQRNAVAGARGRKRTPVKATRNLVEDLRLVKDEQELQAIRKAVNLGASLLDTAVQAIRPGVSELEVAAEIEYAARRAGADAMSFETIVAAGPRSALPHGRASSHAIPRRGFVVLDFGVILGGYCSDMTRTVHVGRASADSRRLYQAVLEAQQAATAAVREGVAAGAVDEAARAVLRRAGYGKFFTHSTGHGVGLEIHEAPRVARRQPARLRAGMVITIEPGAYLGGQGGVRIEDMVAVNAKGCEVLTPAPKELIEL